MTLRPDLATRISPSGWGTVSAALESFVAAARAGDTLFVDLVPRTAAQAASAVELCSVLKLYVSREAQARKSMELPASAPNPKRVGRWLETPSPHLSLLFSPLTERGPPLS